MRLFIIILCLLVSLAVTVFNVINVMESQKVINQMNEDVERMLRARNGY